MNMNPRTVADFAALPPGTVCLDDDGAVWMRVLREQDEDEWQPSDEQAFCKCNDHDMAGEAENCKTRVVYLPGAP